MQRLSRNNYKDYSKYPEKVLQFGEGVFLRAFVDWQIHVMNDETDFNGSVVVVQPRGYDKIEKLNDQDGLYTLFLQGLKNNRPVNEHVVIESISRGINLFTNYDQYIELAGQEELRFIVSNTTEAGILFDPSDQLDVTPQKSFPGKLTAFLYYRYKAFKGDKNRGCIIIPCELIDNNGDVLKEKVFQYAKHWNLDDEFINWLEYANTFCSSLVDRIVPGFPIDSSTEKTEELGYQDDLMVVGEQYHLWVIKGPDSIKSELPIEETGLNILIVDDLTPFRTRKVRILNGAHTAMTPVAYLYGLDTVEESVNHAEVGKYIKDLIIDEIIPTFDSPKEALLAFTNEVLGRFKNPYIKHYLLSISLNSFSKFKTRNLPTLSDYVKQKKRLPSLLVFSLSTLLYFYRGKRGEQEIKLQDDPEVMELCKSLWGKFDQQELGMKDVAATVLKQEQIWGTDLTTIPNLVKTVTCNLLKIHQFGIKAALEDLYKSSSI